MRNHRVYALLAGLFLAAPSHLEAVSMSDLLGSTLGQQITTLGLGALGAYTVAEVVYRRWEKLQKHNDPNKPDVQEFFEGLTQDLAGQAGLVTQENFDAKMKEFCASPAFKAAVIEVIKNEFEVKDTQPVKR